MSSDIVIRVSNLSKRYIIGHQAGRGDGLRHVLQEAVSAPFRALRASLSRKLKSQVETDVSGINPTDINLNSTSLNLNSATSTLAEREEFWALRDVSFEINRGEVVGIIGRNGAGKSTLLKILSRITEPTSGRIEIDGRVASLLEVGTGFHPELTGRENIFLNGAILGMSRAEVRRKFDEIVDFSGVEQFLDTPVKRYSSGMYVRLAFAVAAHLEPEILIVDEVLAVGDAEFQKKCIGKMQDVSKGGRTVLFVSHNMGTVTTLCNRAICLVQGAVISDGLAHEVAGTFLRGMTISNSTMHCDLRQMKHRSGSGEALIAEASIYARAGKTELPMPRMGDTLGVRFLVENKSRIPGAEFRFSVAIKTVNGQQLVHVTNEDDGFQFSDFSSQWIQVELPSLQIYPGDYVLSLWVGSARYKEYDYVKECLRFEVSAAQKSPRAFKTD